MLAEDKYLYHSLSSQDSVNSAAVTRWYNGLINKDITIANEIYSLREVEFDRQVSLVTDYYNYRGHMHIFLNLFEVITLFRSMTSS